MAAFIIQMVLCLLPVNAAAQPLEVVVSVPPQRYFVERLLGDQVHVEVILERGQNPATFSPTPRQFRFIHDAALLYRTGVPFESAWVGALSRINPRLEVLDAREGIPLLPLTGGHTHAEDELDPHIWLSPTLASRMVERLATVLTRLSPEQAATIQKNLVRLQGELEQLHREIGTLLTPMKGHKLMVYHPSWGYFAREYGLQQVAIEVSGKPPGVRALAATIEQAKLRGHQRLFVQPQFDRSRAETIARSINARVVIIDPLAEAYTTNLLAVARLIAEKEE